MLVSDKTEIDCGLTLSIQCLRKGKLYERTEYYPPHVVQGLTLSEVGTGLQRQVYETLKIAYGDALNDRNAVDQGA